VWLELAGADAAAEAAKHRNCAQLCQCARDRAGGVPERLAAAPVLFIGGIGTSQGMRYFSKRQSYRVPADSHSFLDALTIDKLYW
jgi:hypothetical protein